MRFIMADIKQVKGAKMRVRPSILTVVLAAGLLMGGANLLWAQPPGIDIELSL